MPEQCPTVLTDAVVQDLAQRLLADAQSMSKRLVLGIAGIAGSGKSTLGERLADLINDDPNGGPETAAFIPMDGFHLPNATLIERSWKKRKGASFTYDAPAYLALLRHYADPAQTGSYPVYCREVHEPVTSNQSITPATKIIITEGQYLLLPESPWDELAEVLDECWWLEVPPERTREWLMKRDTSVGRSREEAQVKYQKNDRLNTEHVLAAKRLPDRIVTWPTAD